MIFSVEAVREMYNDITSSGEVLLQKEMCPDGIPD